MSCIALACFAAVQVVVYSLRSRVDPVAIYLEGYRDAIRHITEIRLAERAVYRTPVGPFDRALHKIIQTLQP